MEYECGPLLLYSQDKIRMMDFLSDVFEFEVDSIGDSIYRGPLNIRLCELHSDQKKSEPSGIVFSFRVKNEDELKEIMSKYNFFLYRKSESSHGLEKLELFEEDHRKTLTISDLDNRQWRFELHSREV